MSLKYLKNVTTLILSEEKCIGCSLCVTVCPHEVFEVKDKKAVIIHKDNCIECGACAKNCPVDAIKVKAGVGCAYAIYKSKTGGKTGCCC